MALSGLALEVLTPERRSEFEKWEELLRPMFATLARTSASDFTVHLRRPDDVPVETRGTR